MATDLRTAKNGKASKRTRKGQFARGGPAGPGRPKGKPNQTTTDLRAIRDRIATSWGRVDGDELLDQLARDNPREYLRLVVALLPKAHNVDLSNAGPMFVPRVVDFDLDRV